MRGAVTRTEPSRLGELAWRLVRPLQTRAGGNRNAISRMPPRMFAAVFWAVYEDAWDAWSRGDAEVLISIWGEGVVIEMGGVQGWVEREVYRGEAEARMLIEDWRSAWGDLELETQRITVGGGRVLGHFRMSAQGAGSGLPVTIDIFQVSESVPGGVRMAQYTDESEALAAFESGAS